MGKMKLEKLEKMNQWPSEVDQSSTYETGARILGNEIRDSYRQKKYRSQDERKDFADK